MHENSLANLVSGKNKKPGSQRTNIVLSGPARALASLFGEGTIASGVESALLDVATLADKVTLIHEGIWGVPQFDEFGLIRDYGWENAATYKPSRWVLDSKEGIEQYRDIESADPMDLQWALDQYGLEACLEEFRHYDFHGVYRGNATSSD